MTLVGVSGVPAQVSYDSACLSPDIIRLLADQILQGTRLLHKLLLERDEHLL